MKLHLDAENSRALSSWITEGPCIVANIIAIGIISLTDSFEIGSSVPHRNISDVLIYSLGCLFIIFSVGTIYKLVHRDITNIQVVSKQSDSNMKLLLCSLAAFLVIGIIYVIFLGTLLRDRRFSPQAWTAIMAILMITEYVAVVTAFLSVFKNLKNFDILPQSSHMHEREVMNDIKGSISGGEISQVSDENEYNPIDLFCPYDAEKEEILFREGTIRPQSIPDENSNTSGSSSFLWREVRINSNSIHHI